MANKSDFALTAKREKPAKQFENKTFIV